MGDMKDQNRIAEQRRREKKERARLAGQKGREWAAARKQKEAWEPNDVDDVSPWRKALDACTVGLSKKTIERRAMYARMAEKLKQGTVTKEVIAKLEEGQQT